MRYRCVAARKAEGFNVTDACAAAEVSRAAFYAWLDRGVGPTEREWDEALLIDQIRELHAASNGTYGEPRMIAELADRGWVLNRKRTARLMRQERLREHRPRRRRSLTKADEQAPAIPDLVGRAFQPELLDESELICPCHGGHFDAADGRNPAGPPQRPLNRIDLEIRDGVVWALGGGGH